LGTVAFAGDVLLDVSAGVDVPIERRRIGYVFQDHLLFPHLDAEANLRFGMPARAGAPSEISVDRVVASLELGALLKRKPAALSWGQRQRVALGRAILSSPRLLLLDEPLEGLEFELRSRTLDFLERLLNEFAVPILFVSHSQTEVRRLAERVVLVKDGRVAAEGTPDEALTGASALELPAPLGLVNLLKLDRVEVREDSTAGWIGAVELALPPPPPGGTSRYVSVDPTAVTLAAVDVQGVSARNHLRGEVAAIVESRGRVLAAIDVGATLWVEITKAAAAELGLAVGRPVVCLLKAQSLHFV
jgi:molybdate transport system ATP-binding protein